MGLRCGILVGAAIVIVATVGGAGHLMAEGSEGSASDTPAREGEGPQGELAPNGPASAVAAVLYCTVQEQPPCDTSVYDGELSCLIGLLAAVLPLSDSNEVEQLIQNSMGNCGKPQTRADILRLQSDVGVAFSGNPVVHAQADVLPALFLSEVFGPRGESLGAQGWLSSEPRRALVEAVDRRAREVAASARSVTFDCVSGDCVSIVFKDTAGRWKVLGSAPRELLLAPYQDDAEPKSDDRVRSPANTQPL